MQIRIVKEGNWYCLETIRPLFERILGLGKWRHVYNTMCITEQKAKELIEQIKTGTHRIDGDCFEEIEKKEVLDTYDI